MRSHDGYRDLFALEAVDAVLVALEKLREKHPLWALAYEVRDVCGVSRNRAAYLLDHSHRPATITERVKKARTFLRAELVQHWGGMQATRECQVSPSR